MTEHHTTPERRCAFCGFGSDGKRKFLGLSVTAADRGSPGPGRHLCDVCLRVMMIIFAVHDRAGFDRAIDEARAQASAAEAGANDRSAAPAEIWYAAKLRFVVLLEATGSEDANDSIYLLRARGFEEALARALEIGRRAEHEYLGGTGEQVRWRLKEIVTLDALQATDLDGVEVHSQFTPLDDDERYGFDHVFRPEASQPHHTGVV